MLNRKAFYICILKSNFVSIDGIDATSSLILTETSSLFIPAATAPVVTTSTTLLGKYILSGVHDETLKESVLVFHHVLLVLSIAFLI